MKLPEEVQKMLLKDYREKLVKRIEIANRFRIKTVHINYFLRKYKIEIWDDPRKIPYDVVEQVLEEYKNNRLTREEIAIKMKINLNTINLILRNNKIDLWDRKRTIVPKNAGKKKSNNSKYFNPKQDKSSYARMFYEFNN